MKRLFLAFVCCMLVACSTTKPEPQNVLTRTVYKTIPVPKALRPACEFTEETKLATPNPEDLLVMTAEQRATAYFVFIVSLDKDFKLCKLSAQSFNKWLDGQEAILLESSKTDK